MAKVNLDALGIALTANNDEIAEKAEQRFTALSEKTRASIIATMRAA